LHWDIANLGELVHPYREAVAGDPRLGDFEETPYARTIRWSELLMSGNGKE
jgi:hypothetical protein